jgi:hypothetical protein
MGPVSAANSPITAQPASAQTSRRSNALAIVGAAVLLLGLGAGGALAFARKQPGDEGSNVTVTTERADAAASAVTAEPDASSALIAESVSDNPVADAAVAMTNGAAARARSRMRTAQEPVISTATVTTQTPSQTPSQTAQSNPTTAAARTNEHSPNAGANSGAAPSQPSQRTTPSANTPLSEYE